VCLHDSNDSGIVTRQAFDIMSDNEATPPVQQIKRVRKAWDGSQKILDIVIDCITIQSQSV
jgi:hypothetical protein